MGPVLIEQALDSLAPPAMLLPVVTTTQTQMAAPPPGVHDDSRRGDRGVSADPELLRHMGDAAMAEIYQVPVAM
jgi:hypothetical protein